ncbi:hypothetical protein NPIL_579051 [Nephila pilipes]|uniref:Uncharacterized protein n=1 Tax=Nephila pilipes TaxID=299642 RepID=A0A8X6ND62_NEPPI|nr:hypothetical protein NPIL_579051 [Nephila pilipes]
MGTRDRTSRVTVSGTFSCCLKNTFICFFFPPVTLMRENSVSILRPPGMTKVREWCPETEKSLTDKMTSGQSCVRDEIGLYLCREKLF